MTLPPLKWWVSHHKKSKLINSKWQIIFFIEYSIKWNGHSSITKIDNLIVAFYWFVSNISLLGLTNSLYFVLLILLY